MTYHALIQVIRNTTTGGTPVPGKSITPIARETIDTAIPGWHDEAVLPFTIPVAMPPWVLEGLRIKGWHERADNADLRAWLKSDGKTLGDPAVLPWCGDFAETCIRLALPGEAFPGDLGRNPYWALHWRQFGIPCDPCLGAVVSISREGGGHVGFAVGQDATRIFVLGGNQSNEVSVAPIEKSRFIAASWRWPSTHTGARNPGRKPRLQQFLPLSLWRVRMGRWRSCPW